MMYTIFEITTALFECLLVHIFFNGWFGLRRSKRSRVLLFMALFFLLQCSVSLFPVNPIFRTVISFFLILGIAAELYEISRSSVIYGSFLFMALAVVSEYLCLVILNALGFDTGALMTEGNARAIYLALAKTVHFAVVLTAASVLRKNRVALTLKQVAPLLPCLIVSIYICTVFFRIFPNYENDLSLTLVIALIGLLYINGIIVFNTQSIKSAVVENEEQKQAARQYEMQEQYYRNVIKDREETRALWHDINKHVTAIEAIIETGDSQTAKDEYDAIYRAFDKLGMIVDVENEVLNSILYHYIRHAKEHEITVNLTAQVPREISISAVDLSVIIGNTFDNAIEECTMLMSDSREISVSLIQRNNMLFYEIKNSCMEIPHKKSGKYHGYGLKNVNICVQKYNGVMEIEAANGYFCVSIRLNCPSVTV